MTAWLVVPQPTAWWDVEVKVASVGLVPHSNQAVVDRPFGFTLPFNLALLAVTALAAFVITMGAACELPANTMRRRRTVHAHNAVFIPVPLLHGKKLLEFYKKFMQ